MAVNQLKISFGAKTSDSSKAIQLKRLQYDGNNIIKEQNLLYGVCTKLSLGCWAGDDQQFIRTGLRPEASVVFDL